MIRVEFVSEHCRDLIAESPDTLVIGDTFSFTEGPVWLPDTSELLFSDIPEDILYRWKEGEGVSVWRKPSFHANGNTRDAEGALLTCEHGARVLSKTPPGGDRLIIADRYDGKLLNSPNDVVVKRDGTIWFTDPTYGIQENQREQSACHVFRLGNGAVEPVPVVSDFPGPNGLCFSPDESMLYIADSSKQGLHIRKFRVTPSNTLIDDGVFTDISPGVPDGVRTDSLGNLYSTAGDGVQIFSPEGQLLGKILVPESPANCTFGGPEGNQLFITARRYVVRVQLLTS